MKSHRVEMLYRGRDGKPHVMKFDGTKNRVMDFFKLRTDDSFIVMEAFDGQRKIIGKRNGSQAPF